MRGAASVSFGNTVLTFNSLIVGSHETRIWPCVGNLLRVLTYNRNTLVSVERIHDAIYSLDSGGGPDYDCFAVLVSHARKAMRIVGSDSRIANQRARGYMLVCERDKDADVSLMFSSVQYDALQKLVRYARPSLPRLADLVAAAVETPRVVSEIGGE